MHVTMDVTLEPGRELPQETAEELAAGLLELLGGDAKQDLCSVAIHKPPDIGRVGPWPEPPPPQPGSADRSE